MANFPINFAAEGYQLSDSDSSADPSYYGYLMSTGKWYIQEVNAENGTYRYVSGRTDYTTNWADRANLAYGLFSSLAI